MEQEDASFCMIDFDGTQSLKDGHMTHHFDSQNLSNIDLWKSVFVGAIEDMWTRHKSDEAATLPSKYRLANRNSAGEVRSWWGHKARRVGNDVTRQTVQKTFQPSNSLQEFFESLVDSRKNDTPSYTLHINFTYSQSLVIAKWQS